MSDYQTYGDTLAQYDFDEQRLRRLLAQRLAMSDENRAASLTTGRETNSARGLLQSSIALDDQTKRNTDYARQDAETNQNFNDDLATIGRGRVSATSAYNASMAEQERQAALDTPLFQTVDPSDPLGWKKIAEQLKAQGDPNFQDYGATEDPLNWEGIAAQLGAQGDPNFAQYAPSKPDFTPGSYGIKKQDVPSRMSNPLPKKVGYNIFRS